MVVCYCVKLSSDFLKALKEGQHLGKHMHVQYIYIYLNGTNEKFNAHVQYLIGEIAHTFINEYA